MKLDYYYVIYFLIVLPFLFPVYFSESETLQLFEYIITYLSLGLMAALILADRKKQISYFPFVLLFLEYAILLCSTWAFHGQFGTTLKTTIKKLLLFYVIGKALLSDRKITCFMQAVRDICVIIFLINFVTEIIYPAGIPSTTPSAATPHYFLGNINSVIRAVFPGICCSILLSDKKGKKIS